MSNVLGNISFQANDKMDVFHVAQVMNEGIEPSDNTLLQIEDSQFDSDKAWVTGNVPKLKPVHVEGDTSIINAWFKGETYENPFVITVYVECETAEELEEVTADEEIEQDKRSRNDFLEPVEINL
ncbi:MAG: hypothetical protein KF763_16095 [Cyclobacteriaceae bacterium]|jgi:hypothetical protein|nr:hypothetical protein [Cyclobacteriaceae bacterium]